MRTMTAIDADVSQLPLSEIIEPIVEGGWMA